MSCCFFMHVCYCYFFVHVILGYLAILWLNNQNLYGAWPSTFISQVYFVAIVVCAYIWWFSRLDVDHVLCHLKLQMFVPSFILCSKCYFCIESYFSNMAKTLTYISNLIFGKLFVLSFSRCLSSTHKFWRNYFIHLHVSCKRRV